MKTFLHIAAALVCLLPLQSSFAGVELPRAEALIASAPRISLDKKGISSFEVRGIIAGGGVSLRFIASGQKPGRYSLALIDPHDNTPIAVATQERLTFYNPLTGRVTVVKNIAPILELESHRAKAPEPGNTLNLNIGFAPPGGKEPIRMLIDIRSLLSGETFEVHADKKRVVLDGMTRKGSKTTAYFTQSKEKAACERVEITPYDARGGRPVLVLDSILINPPLTPQRFLFPEDAIKNSGMPITEVINNAQTPIDDFRTMAGALMARAVMYDLVKNSKLKLTEAEWNRLKKSDSKIAAQLRTIFAEQLALPGQ